MKKIYFTFLIAPFCLLADDHKAQGNSIDWEIEAVSYTHLTLPTNREV